MAIFVTVIHVVVSIIMLLFILLQEGKSGMGSIGGGVGASAFGARGRGTPLSRLTAAAATTFMITSMTLAWLSTQEHSVIGSDPETPAAATAPATPEASPAAPDVEVTLDEPAPEAVEAEGSDEGDDAEPAAPAEPTPEQ